MRVSQVLCAAGPVDAVTGQALACRRLFQSWGWEGTDHAPVIAPGTSRHAVAPLEALHPVRGEVLVVHYSGYAPEVDAVVDCGAPTLVISHNVTPARYFWQEDPLLGVRCALAPGQLADLAVRAKLAAGVSEFNAAELRRATGRDDVLVIPILFDRSRLGPAGTRGTGRAGEPHILFVGRLAPHKRQDLLIEVCAELCRRGESPRLDLVGTPMSPPHAERLARLAERRAPGAVRFEHGLPAAALAERYRGADVFLCLSEHEGFCIPLLEALHFGLPVLARDAAAVSEVLGDAGLLLDDRDDVRTIAQLILLVAADGELRSELRERGERRMAAYDLGVTAARLRSAVERLAA